MRCVALHHWKCLAAKYTRKATVNAVERVFETKYKQENISDVTLPLKMGTLDIFITLSRESRIQRTHKDKI